MKKYILLPTLANIKISFVKNCKKLYFVNSAFLILNAALYSGCTKDAENVKLKEIDPKLVIGCFISPQDTMIVATVMRSNPIFGKNHNSNQSIKSIVNAQVIISNGTQTITLPYNSIKDNYEIAATLFPITSGATYQLEVTTPENGKVSAECTVPPVNVDSINVTFDTLGASKELILKWKDIPNQSNYYKVFVQEILVITSEFFGTLHHDTTYGVLWTDKSLMNDVDQDGNIITTKYQIFFDHYGGGGGNGGPTTKSKTIGFNLYLMNISDEYYKYEQSLNRYGYDNPFSEPSPIYSNVKGGGLGIFAGYQKLEVKIDLP